MKDKIAAIQSPHKEESMLSSLAQIRADIRLLDDVIPEATQELDIVYKEVIQQELTQGDVDTLLEQIIKMMDSTCETVSQLHGRLMSAVAVIREEEVKGESKGEKIKEAREIGFTPKLMTSFLPEKQHMSYLSEKATEKI